MVARVARMFRRNGKPVSCEPCRVSKIRCDHHRPICRRCQTRKKESQCFYHPAPLTRPRPNSRPKPPQRNNDNSSSSSSNKARQSNSVGAEQPPTEAETYDSPQQPGYLGSTSFASVFPAPELLFPADTTAVPTLSLPSDFCSLRLSYAHSHLLKLVSSFSKYQSLVVSYYDRGQFSLVPRELVLSPLAETGSHLERLNNDADSPERRALLEGLSKKSCKRLPTHTGDAAVDEFCASFSGPSLRWEFVGIIFALAGLASSYPDAGGPFKSGEFALEMFAASQTCIEICEQHDQLNDLTIWLRYITVVLASNLYGDMSNIVYRSFSELVSQTFAMGLHRQSSLPGDVPFFLSETRKRVFAATFTKDKSLATYLGRPPLIDSYFCDLVLPHDLDDDEITHPEGMRDSLLNNLDRDGWNVNNNVPERPLRPVTGTRLRCCMAMLREKVLRLSLGNGVDNKAHLPAVLEEYRKAWEAVPQQYRYHNECWKRLDPHSCVVYLIVYLDYCYTGYQLHRLLRRQNEGSRAVFLETAMNLLSAMTDFAQRQAQTVALRGRYMWVFLFYGLPGAGSLVSELHRCNMAGIPFPRSVSRPKVIRELSVLVSWLDNSTFPDRPEYRTCRVISTLIGRLLDDALLPVSTSQQPPAAQEGRELDTALITAESQGRRLSRNIAVGRASHGAGSQQSQMIAPVPQSLGSDSNPLHAEETEVGFSEGFSELLSTEDCVNWLDGMSWDSHPLVEGWPVFSDNIF